MLKAYLMENFGYNEPIFLNELSIEGLSENAIEFADAILDSFYANEESINKIISDLAKGYEFERISTRIYRERSFYIK